MGGRGFFTPMADRVVSEEGGSGFSVFLRVVFLLLGHWIPPRHEHRVSPLPWGTHPVASHDPQILGSTDLRLEPVLLGEGFFLGSSSSAWPTDAWNPVSGVDKVCGFCGQS